MGRITLSNGSYSLVDDDIIEKYGHIKWSDNGYAFTSIIEGGKKRTVYLHRLIMNPPPDMVVDHINGDKLDNRRSNLRICSHRQNLWNTKRVNVDYRKDRKKWRARIERNKRSVFLGHYNTREEAVNAYVEALEKYSGEYANAEVMGK